MQNNIDLYRLEFVLECLGEDMCSPEYKKLTEEATGFVGGVDGHFICFKMGCVNCILQLVSVTSIEQLLALWMQVKTFMYTHDYWVSL